MGGGGGSEEVSGTHAPKIKAPPQHPPLPPSCKQLRGRGGIFAAAATAAVGIAAAAAANRVLLHKKI